MLICEGHTRTVIRRFRHRPPEVPPPQPDDGAWERVRRELARREWLDGRDAESLGGIERERNER